MVVALDSNVVLDLAYVDAPHHKASRVAIEQAGLSGDLIVGEVVCSELASRFTDHELLQTFLAGMDVTIIRSSWESLHQAGKAFAEYSRRRGPVRCPRCGSPVQVPCESCGALVTRRQHILADFMIGAHALTHAGRLLTRDRGYYATYFPELVLV